MASNKKKTLIIGITAIVLSTLEIAGYQLSMKLNTSVHQSTFFKEIGMLSLGAAILAWVTGTIAAAFFITMAFKAVDRWREKVQKKEDIRVLNKNLFWWGIAILLFGIWSISLYAAYPGYYNYDAIGQLAQAMYPEVPYTTFHPPLHTFIMGKIITCGYHYSGGNLMTGVFWFNLFQMAVCAICFAYFLRFIWKHSRRVWLLAVMFCYYGAFPTIVLFTMSTTKDVPCALAMQFVLFAIYHMFRSPETFFSSKKSMAGGALAMVLMCLLRKNCIFALIAFLAICIIMWKDKRKKMSAFGAAVIMLYLISNSCINALLQAKPDGKMEALSVPVQQIARVYVEKGPEAFSEEEIQLLGKMIYVEDFYHYNPLISDEIKNRCSGDGVWANKGEFFKLWVSVGLRNPGTYMMSFLENTYQLWYPGTSITKGEEKLAYFDFDGYHSSIDKIKNIKSLYKFYKKISYQHYYQKLPVVRLLFSQGAMLWLVIFAFSYGLYKKDRGLYAVAGMILLYCGTVLMGPVMLIRYVLILFYGFPVLIALLLRK